MKRNEIHRFRLYIAGEAPNSMLAIANLSRLCHVHLPDRHEIEVIDVFLDPTRAMEDSVFMTPTLVRFRPLPLRRIVGTLSNTATVLHALGLHERAA